ncbi:DoxX family protein [Sanguibacter antarcticus]|uniref:Thiosulfate dehydrogenase [quinone] large subunit n=1 Tax=Sanguibacter antarcticus TaxID=372484 RepID=A0A2A9E0U2_9MICO|nr:DoxX family protein [Sanguibacter antarcticus]PFG32667.1 thiosulfate dehydrogenase [quinone] large subunit [Sanguibacter antarcticus]
MATHTDAQHGETTAVVTGSDIVVRAGARRWLAVARIGTGFIFLWAFLDKTFGLQYSTGAATTDGSPASLSWLDGGTPSQGFMTFGTVGPFKDLFATMASPLTDWLFMIGMLGVGLALILGIGLRVAAVSGTVIMLLMWVAEWPLLRGSTNPIMDYHVVYALVLIIAATTLAGDTWGLGRRWAAIPLVQRQPWLR